MSQKSLPDAVRQHSEMRDLAVHAGFIRTAQQVPLPETLERTIAAHPDDLESRYQLCTLRMTQNAMEDTMEQLLVISRRDNTFRLLIGRNGLLAISPCWDRKMNMSCIATPCSTRRYTDWKQ